MDKTLTKQIVFMAVTLFIGLFQFGTSKLIQKKSPETKRDITINHFVKQWGRNALIYSGIFMPFYYFKPEKVLAIVLIYLLLLAYNVRALKKGLRKVERFYPTSDPDGKLISENNQGNNQEKE